MTNPVKELADHNLALILLRQLRDAVDNLLIEASRYDANLPTHPQGRERAKQLRHSLSTVTKYLNSKPKGKD